MRLATLALLGLAIAQAQNPTGPFRPGGAPPGQASQYPQKGPGYIPSAAAVIDAAGLLEAATGSATNCVLVNGTSAPCGTGGAGGSWGTITGTLSSQTDLENALNTKPTAALVISVGSPGSNTNVPSEAAVRTLFNTQLQLSVYNVSTLVGTQSALRFSPGNGLLFPCSNNNGAGSVDCAPVPDWNYVLQNSTFQAGAPISAIGTSSGAGVTFAATLNPPIAAYNQNQWITFLPQDSACQSGASLNLNGIGPINLKKVSGGSLVGVGPGDCPQGVPVWLAGYGSPVSAFIVYPVNPVASGAANQLAFYSAAGSQLSPISNVYADGTHFTVGTSISSIDAQVTLAELWDTAPATPTTGTTRSTFSVYVGSAPDSMQESVFPRRNAINAMIDVPAGGIIGSIAAVSGECRTASTGCIGGFFQATATASGRDNFALNTVISDNSQGMAGTGTLYGCTFCVGYESDDNMNSSSTVTNINIWAVANSKGVQPSLDEAFTCDIFNSGDIPNPLPYGTGCYTANDGASSGYGFYAGSTARTDNGTLNVSGTTITSAGGSNNFRLIAGNASAQPYNQMYIQGSSGWATPCTNSICTVISKTSDTTATINGSPASPINGLNWNMVGGSQAMTYHALGTAGAAFTAQDYVTSTGMFLHIAPSGENHQWWSGGSFMGTWTAGGEFEVGSLGGNPTWAQTSMLGALSGSDSRIGAVSFGGAGRHSSLAFGGTVGSPSAVGSGTVIAAFDASAYNGSANNYSIAGLQFVTNQAQTTSNGGTFAQMLVTPNGSTTEASVMRWENDGGIDCTGVTGGDEGAGTLNCAGLYDTGSRVLSAGSDHISLSTATGTLTGTATAGSATCRMPSQTPGFKLAICFLSAYQETSTAQTWTFPTAFSTVPLWFEAAGGTNSQTACGTYNATVSASTLTLPANAAMTAETCQIVLLGT